MASRHEIIKDRVILDWTQEGKGRLFSSSQAMATPIGSDHPVWFGPMSRKASKGWPDLYGYEWIDGTPVFCTVEVKTINDGIKPDQKKKMNILTRHGCRCYVAQEREEGGYLLIRYEGEKWHGSN